MMIRNHHNEDEVTRRLPIAAAQQCFITVFRVEQTRHPAEVSGIARAAAEVYYGRTHEGI